MCGAVVYAGVDYADIMAEAEKEADIILWDGGNNDTPHYKSDVYITVVDPLRAGNELTYFPGKINFERADTLIINKCDQASDENMATVMRNIEKHNPRATVIKAAAPIHVADPSAITGKRVLVVEDGPTLTHGGMRFGAGVLAARQCGAAEMIDPRPFLVGSMKDVFKTYPHIGPLLPAIGYGKDQMADLEATINATNADCVILATPADLSRLLCLSLPHTRVTYELQEIGSPTLEDVLKGL